MGEHDASYRRLFEHSQLLRDLLACVLDADWLARLDWSGLQPVNIHYVSDQLHERAGDGAWRAPLDMAALIEPRVSDLADYQLRMRYLLVDEGALLRAGGLPDRNLAALLFRLEHSDSIEKLQEILHTLQQVLQGPGFEELDRSFTAYVRHIVLSRAQPREALPPVTNLQEIAMLISEKPGIWARQWEQEGIQKGEAALLERQLIRKFGAISDDMAKRIRSATAAQLETWSLNILDAQILEDVFRQ